MNYPKMLCLMTLALCVTVICVYGQSDIAPSAINLLWLVLARARL